MLNDAGEIAGKYGLAVDGGRMLIAYLAIGVLTGLVFSTLTIVVGHAFPFAVIAYVLTGMGAVCLAAYRAAQLPENQ